MSGAGVMARRIIALIVATLALSAASCDSTPAPTPTPATQTGDTYTPPPLTRQQKRTIREQLRQAPDQWEQEFCRKHPDLCDQGTLQ